MPRRQLPQSPSTKLAYIAPLKQEMASRFTNKVGKILAISRYFRQKKPGADGPGFYDAQVVRQNHSITR